MSDMLRGGSPDGYLPDARDGNNRVDGPSDNAGLLPQRSAAILGGAAVVAVVAGALTFLCTYLVVGGPRGAWAGLAAAVIAAGPAFVSSARFLHWVIAR